jgi:hypothetical protein
MKTRVLPQVQGGAPGDIVGHRRNDAIPCPVQAGNRNGGSIQDVGVGIDFRPAVVNSMHVMFVVRFQSFLLENKGNLILEAAATISKHGI